MSKIEIEQIIEEFDSLRSQPINIEEKTFDSFEILKTLDFSYYLDLLDIYIKDNYNCYYEDNWIYYKRKEE